MAVRLPLILSQPAKRDATAVELIENIVAAALLLPKLDANLIGDISSIEPGGTDHLCLQGHTRDVILASFLDLATAQASWQRLGQSGHFVDCQQSTESIRQLASSASGRRVFYFQLTHNVRVPRLLDQCQELVAAQAVQLVSIQFGGVSKPTTGALPILPKTIATPTVAPTEAANSKPANGHAHSAAASVVPNTSKSSPSLASGANDDDEDWSSIDKLVDDLDAMDI